MPVTSCSVKPRSARYTRSMGANWLAPHPAASMAKATRVQVCGVAAACRASMGPFSRGECYGATQPSIMGDVGRRWVDLQ